MLLPLDLDIPLSASLPCQRSLPLSVLFGLVVKRRFAIPVTLPNIAVRVSFPLVVEIYQMLLLSCIVHGVVRLRAHSATDRFARTADHCLHYAETVFYPMNDRQLLTVFAMS